MLLRIFPGIPVILLLLSALVSSSWAGEDPVTWLSDREEAVRVAKAQEKIILVVLFTDDCGFCKRLGRETHPHPDVQDLLKKLVPLKVNARPSEPDPGNTAFVDDLVKRIRAAGEKIKGVPASVVTDPDWNVIGFLSGFRTPKAYGSFLRPLVEASGDRRNLKAKVKAGEADYETLYRYVKACHVLKEVEEVREYGEKGLGLAEGEHHADLAYFLAMTFDPGDTEFELYKKKALDLDPENRKGYFDEFAVLEARRIVRSIRTHAEKTSKVNRAKKLLEKQLARKRPKLHPERGQMIYWALFQLYIEHKPRNVRKAKEMLRKGITLLPYSEMGKAMSERLKDLGN